VFGDYQSTEPSRFIDEIPAELIEEVPASFAVPQPSFSQFRSGGYGHGVRRISWPRTGGTGSLRVRGRGSVSAGGTQTRLRVRHPQFGVGTVISVEPLDDDTKADRAVQFGGQKTLRAKYAKLEVA
jgi:hypothetical protein